MKDKIYGFFESSYWKIIAVILSIGAAVLLFYSISSPKLLGAQWERAQVDSENTVIITQDGDYVIDETDYRNNNEDDYDFGDKFADYLINLNNKSLYVLVLSLIITFVFGFYFYRLLDLLIRQPFVWYYNLTLEDKKRLIYGTDVGIMGKINKALDIRKFSTKCILLVLGIVGVGTIIMCCYITAQDAKLHPVSMVVYENQYVDLDIMKTHDNFEPISYGPFEDKNGNEYYRDGYVEHLVDECKILDKWVVHDENHIRFDWKVNSNWKSEFKSVNCNCYCVSIRVFLTDERDLKKNPKGFIDFDNVEIYKSEYEKLVVGKKYIMHRDCYFDSKGLRISQIDRYEVRKE